VYPSYRTFDQSQQIDGALEIKNHIFLLEVKWEETATLAASKLYSFLGKINSKIEGTLGIFISYNKLESGFLSSIRSGIRQNCIVIHGEENILPIIDGDIQIDEYIWYIYKESATKNRISIPISEFQSLPKSVDTTASGWVEIYRSLVGEDDAIIFAGIISYKYNRDFLISKKFFDVYTALPSSSNVKEKIRLLVQKLIEEEYEAFSDELTKKLLGPFWIRFADENLIDILYDRISFDLEEAKSIKNNVFPYLIEVEGQWEEENKVSRILDLIYQNLDAETKRDLAKGYAEIYCDTSRKDRYAQKKFSEKLFRDVDEDPFKLLEDKIRQFIIDEKQEEDIFGDSSEEQKREYVLRHVGGKYRKIIETQKYYPNVYQRLEEIYNSA